MRHLAVRFLRAREGSSTLEFAILAIPFFTIIFMILETAIVLIAQISLDRAVERTARLVETGQVQSAALTKDGFRQALCAQADSMLTCDNFLFDLNAYTSLAAIPTTISMVGGQVDTSKFSYNVPGPSTMFALRVYYKWPIFTSLAAAYLATTSDNGRVLTSMWALKTEPF